MRKVIFETNEFYHIYNRGNNKRPIFLDPFDFNRFLEGMTQFNTENAIGSIYQNSFKKDQLGSQASKLIEIVCYCLNPNHYHFILKQVADNGISKFMHRLGTGYTKYFNEKHKNSGSLFQGPYKAIRANSNEYILHLSCYVNLNYKVHSLGSLASKSSWNEYVNQKDLNYTPRMCKKEIILSQFKNTKDYEEFALKSLKTIKQKKELEKLLFD